MMRRNDAKYFLKTSKENMNGTRILYICVSAELMPGTIFVTQFILDVIKFHVVDTEISGV